MRKQLAAILLVSTMLFLLAGCSFSLYQREAERTDVYKEFISAEVSGDDDYTTRVSLEKSAAVVSVISHSVIRTNRGSSGVTQIYSGVILNAEGYVLTTSNAALLQVSSGGNVYSNEVMSAYAVLSDAYKDSTHYKLTLVDCDESVGLALFRFYDSFHYYTDASKTASERGFQVTAEFSAENIETGDLCIGIGNSLGNALNDGIVAPSSIREIALTVMSGIVSDAKADNEALEPIAYKGKKYSYILTTVPVNIDMYGGALYDKNGYMIGSFAMKLGYQSSTTGESGYFKRVGVACGVPLLTAYIDAVAEEIQSPIPYTVAKVSGEEVA